MLVLIPAYQPGDPLVELVRSLRAHPSAPHVLVVDDGSGPDHDEIFALARLHGAEVIRYRENRGKGHALKTGFEHARRTRPADVVVCADCDGQHRAADILRVADAVDPSRLELVLGQRRFTGRVPLRSRWGNRLTSWLFTALTGLDVIDTQTGLRAYPPSLLAWLVSVPGERFEYELAVLLRAPSAGIGIKDVAIETVYIRDNAGSHFRPVIDSWRIYRPLLAFAGSSLAGFVTDLLALMALVSATGNLLLSVIGARIISGIVNYHLNRRAVFRAGNRRSPLRYTAVALGLLAMNYLLLSSLLVVMPLVPAKVLTELSLLAVSFLVQRAFVFTREEPEELDPIDRFPVDPGSRALTSREPLS